MHDRRADQGERGQHHVAAAAQHARERVGDPYDDRAGEQRVRVRQRMLENFAPAAEQAVHFYPEKQN